MMACATCMDRRMNEGTRGVKRGRQLTLSEVVDTLGGDRDNVCRVLSDDHLEWDADVITKLLRWGAQPPLLRTGCVVHRQGHAYVLCTFVDPSDRNVDVFLPRSMVQLVYAVF